MAKSKSGGNPRSIPGGKTQVNFNINEDLLYKVKYIVFHTPGLTNSDVYNAGTENYVKDYEKKNGKISKPKN